MRITVFGSGYVGLVTAAGLAELGHSVLCVDIDPDRVQRLEAGEMPFFEPGLPEIVARNRRGGRLSCSTRIEGAHTQSDFFFIAVGTHPSATGHADVRSVHAAAETIAKAATAPATIAIKSTVPVGTGDHVEAAVRAIGSVRLDVASNPEFLKEGTALDDFFKPDRVLLGVADEETGRRLHALYRPLQLSSDRTLIVDRRSAELAKYAANAMLAVRISFMNEMARLCDEVGADVGAVRRAIGSDHRIGPAFLYAGPGYGGSCLPKDAAALAMLGADEHVEMGIVRAAAEANRRAHAYVVDLLRESLGGSFEGKTVAVWGLAFKPETDDVRESPAAVVVRAVLDGGGQVRAHDPEAAGNFARAHAPEAMYFERELEAIEGADALVLMTEWRQFRNPDFDAIRRGMRSAVILDARNVWESHRLNELGFRYRGIGTRAGRP